MCRFNTFTPLGYNALHISIVNPSQRPSGGPDLFVPPRYNVACKFVPTHTQVLYKGPNIHPPPRGSNRHSPSSSNQIGSKSHSVTSGFQLQVGGQPQVGGHNRVYGKYTLGLQRQPWNFPFQLNKQHHGGKNPQLNSFVPRNLRKPYPGSINPT
jgi:hypothetical protein